jgi:putative MATE family efflux protein
MEKNMSTKKVLLNKSGDPREKKEFYKLVFALVLPMALQNLINVGVSSADVIMLGKVGETALSASSLANQIQFIMSLFFFGLTSGASVLTAQYWGKQDVTTIEKIFGMAMSIALIVGAIFTVTALLFPASLMSIFTKEQDIIEQGVIYLRIIAFSYTLTAITSVYLNIMRSVERVIISTIVYLISLTTNVILNYILIFGKLGFDPMGIKGAAIATLIARTIELLIVFIYHKFYNKLTRFRIKDLFLWDKLLIKDFLTYTVPVMLNELVWGGGTAANAAIMGHLGKSVVAANSVTQVTRQLAMVVAFGLSNATAIILGKAIGEEKYDKAKLYAKRFVKISIILGIIGTFIILGVSQVAGSFLSLSTEAESYLKFMMFVMSYFALGQSFNATLVVGVFRAGGDTKFGLIIDAVTLWGCSIFLGYLAAFVFKLPIPIVYVILMSDEIIKLPFTYKRYKSMKWLKNITR